MRTWLSRLWRRMRPFRADRDLKDELRTHIELLTEDQVAHGLPLGEARRRARLQLGNTQILLERIRDQEFATILDGWRRDFLLGMRALRKMPVFCFTAILTLALGIGANTAVFTLLYGLLLRSLPVPSAHRLARISMFSAAQARGPDGSIAYRMVQEFRRHQQSFTDIATWIGGRIAIEDSDGALRFQNADMVSGNAFEVLGMKPYMGRLIAPSDDGHGVPATGWPVVLSYGFWKDRFGADPEIIGKPIKFSNAIATVIGVTPPDFHGTAPGADTKLYLPVQFVTKVMSGRDDLDSPNSLLLCQAMGRLRPGVSMDQANAEIAVYQQQLRELVPPAFRRAPFLQKLAFRVESARTGFPSFFGRTYSEPLYLMQGLVAVVLLLCCANVGGLMMSKVYARQHEFAIRTAIGAARWRLIRQYLTESFVLAATGAALGAAVAWYGNNFLLHFFRHPMIGEWMSVEPDRTVLLVTALCALATTLSFGLWPALRAGRTDPGVLLKSRTAGARRQTAGRTFLPVQVAVSLALVTLATLLSRSLVRLRGEHTGFDVKQVTIQTAPINVLRLQPDARLDLYQRIVDRIEQMPGIDSAAVTWQTPMTGRQMTASFQALTGANSPDEAHLAYNDVGPGYFRTMKTRLVAGREFERSERSRSVCIVNESAAQYLFPHQQPIGSYVRSTDTKTFPAGVTCRVIAEAEDAKFGSLREPPPRTIYLPLTKDTVATGNMVFLIHSATKAEAMAGYRKALGEIAPTVPLVLFATLAEQMDAALGSETIITMMSDFFGGLALLLSAIGLYGLLASSVAQRTGEIGVRIALGAPRRGVLWMILRDALRLVGVGVVLGSVILFFGVRLVREMLYGVSGFDPLTWMGTAAVLVLVAIMAGLIPALRAASTDPIEALRAE